MVEFLTCLLWQTFSCAKYTINCIMPLLLMLYYFINCSGVGNILNSNKTSRTSMDTSNYYDTTGLHLFVKNNFTGSVLIEEHLVSFTLVKS